MRTMNVGTILLASGLLLGACEEKSTMTLGSKSAEGCDLALDNLAGTDWVILEVKGDKSEEPNQQTRLRMKEEGGVLKAQYTVASLSDVYTYNCEPRGNELMCKEEPKVKDWCQALIAGGGECTPETLRGIDGAITDAQIKEGMEAADEVVQRVKKNDQWKQFVFQNNNLGNKLQGIIYIRVDERRCRLVITDHYMTIFNGKRIEDSNPVGTNPFVRTDKELLWEHCTDSEDLVAMKEAGFPKSEKELHERVCVPNRNCTFEAGEAVHYHYVGQDARKPEGDCTYDFDLWLNWEPLKKGVAATTEDVRGGKELRWYHTQTFQDAGPVVLTMIRNKTCEGKREQVEVACNLVLVK